MHPSAFTQGIIEEGHQWFYSDYGYASKLLKDIYKKYKQFLTTSRKQRKYVKDNFSMQAMTEEFHTIMKENIPEPVKLNLPKLKLPKLEKIND